MPLELTASLAEEAVDTTQGRRVNATLSVTCSDSRTFLPDRKIVVTVDWGDGSTLAHSGDQASPYTSAFTHVYRPGRYIITLKGYNYASPKADIVVKTFTVSYVTPRTPSAPVTLLPYTSGPVMDEEGRPALGTNEEVQKADLALLLNTRLGSLLYEPDYGVAWHSRVFDPADTRLAYTLSTDARTAISRWLPDLDVLAVEASRTGEKEMSISVRVRSRTSGRAMDVTQPLSL